MSAPKTSLASTAFSSVAVIAVPTNTVVNESSSGHARFKRLGAVTTLSSIAACGLNQAQEGFSRNWPGGDSKKAGVVLVRNQGVVGVEAPAVENIEAGDSDHKVVIVGAGIVGLFVAFALHRSALIPWSHYLRNSLAIDGESEQEN